MGISYQLYCARKFPPLSDTLAMLAAAGYREVEGYGALYTDVPAIKAALDANGLTMSSGHFAFDAVSGDPEGTIATARELGIGKVFVPFLMPDARPTDLSGWRAFAERLAAAGKPVVDAGLGYGWHNHDFELADLGGVTPLDLIAEAGVPLELDLGWVRVAGHDPVQWIEKYAGEIAAVHVKDIAPDGQAADEDGWADVGHGIIDWAPIAAALKAAGIDHMVVEHDNPSDPKRFAERSLASVKGF